MLDIQAIPGWPEDVIMIGYPEYIWQYLQGTIDAETLAKKVTLIKNIGDGKTAHLEAGGFLEQFRHQLELFDDPS